MHQQHNPITDRIEERRTKWKVNVKDDCRLVRWLLKSSDAPMYEAFCRLEASGNGVLDEVFVFFYTPFDNPATFSRSIINDWVSEIRKDEHQQKRLCERGFNVDHWDQE